MAEPWILNIKPTFPAELLALPPKEVAQINKKLLALTEDPARVWEWANCFAGLEKNETGTTVGNRLSGPAQRLGTIGVQQITRHD